MHAQGPDPEMEACVTKLHGHVRLEYGREPTPIQTDPLPTEYRSRSKTCPSGAEDYLTVFVEDLAAFRREYANADAANRPRRHQPRAPDHRELLAGRKDGVARTLP